MFHVIEISNAAVADSRNVFVLTRPLSRVENECYARNNFVVIKHGVYEMKKDAETMKKVLLDELDSSALEQVIDAITEIADSFGYKSNRNVLGDMTKYSNEINELTK